MSYIGNVKVGSTTHLVGSTLYGTCNTAAGTAEKAVTCANFDQLLTGVTIHVKFDNTNTIANPTLNVNNTGAKAIKRYGTTAPSTSVQSSWYAGAVISFTYDGTYWMMDDWTYTADGNDTSTLRTYYSRPTVDTNGIKQYSLFAYTKNIKVASFTTNNGTGTKTFNTTDYFDIRKIFYYNGSGNVASNAKLGNNTMSLNENLVDMRYTFNGVTTDASTSSLVAEKPVYICFNIEDYFRSGCARIVEPYFTQEPSIGAYILYVLIGYMHDSYRCSLLMDNQTYMYNYGEGAMRPYPIIHTAAIAEDSNAVNGHIVGIDVPSNAVFTDTKVSQILDSSNQNRPLIMAGTTISDTNSSMTSTVARNNNIYANPYTGYIYAGASTGIENSNKLVTGADIYSAGLMLDYSTTEQATGKHWIDGKEIYQLTVDCGTMPAAAHSKSVSLTYSDGTYIPIDMVVNYTSMTSNRTGDYNFLINNYTGISSQGSMNIYIASSSESSTGTRRRYYISIYCNSDRSTYKLYFTLWYTKRQ